MSDQCCCKMQSSDEIDTVKQIHANAKLVSGVGKSLLLPVQKEVMRVSNLETSDTLKIFLEARIANKSIAGKEA